ncbi:hypothetical protein [Nocardioides sp. B-3]|nr:hypothetical protein [Nocardioides sp. B-3]
MAEIGVHHGRSFLLLANGLAAGEPAVAPDVFEHRGAERRPLGQG